MKSTQMKVVCFLFLSFLFFHSCFYLTPCYLTSWQWSGWVDCSRLRLASGHTPALPPQLNRCYSLGYISYDPAAPQLTLDAQAVG